ncbi:glycoside hydrolase family 3 N-terminal domain-containing protein [Terrabacter sp. MAHUQ-38]|uniref:glycoside hydrolase family 3 N-terminal domain-containing protein n=1 Tax=unclassified Terrabacter TaxID=2630222 RepID=UPI00165E0320|nr:glycoside hydrolase family 3 N-terminal domain-containing protein [Terrabacter sp. MAHUQ-38]MBC9821138.1 peptidoglycan-binding protein [Terrabacter sp. MAHUQ-38]
MRSRPVSLLAASLGAALALVGVGVLAFPAAPVVSASPASPPLVAAGPVALALTPAAAAQAVYDRMTTAQRIGQLFMVGGAVTGLGSATTTAISTYHVGNLVLTGRTTTGTPPVRYLTGRVDTLTTAAATSGVPLFIASDQEGGYVQVLQGPGFSRMPTALTQGTWSDTTLTAYARTWGTQVMRSGVDVDLAPVMDTVAKSFASLNRPIGYYQREYGYTPTAVADKGTTFLEGMKASGLAMTAKHFPGLGRVTGNTDTTAGVTDTVTTRTSADLVPFRAAISAGARLLMVSSAYYARIDASHPAAFSPTVIRGMIRGDLAFSGIVISDDLGNAKQVAAWSPGARAVGFIGSGGDVVLTVNPYVIPAMVNAVTARAASDSVFRGRVQAAVLRVLTVKAQYGLLSARLPITGYFGPLTKTALQRWLGITPTGIFDSATIRALQARIGAPAVGVWGPRSMAAMQSYLGLYLDGATTWNTRTVAGLQRYLNTQL